MMRKVMFSVLMAALVITTSAWAADLSGTWTISFTKVDGAEDSFDVAIKDAGGSLTITGTHSQLGALSGSGTLNGDAVTMDIKATGQLPLEMIFSGKVAGNKISGTREIKMTGTQSGSAPAAGGQSGQAAGGQSGQAPASGGQGAQGAATGEASNAFTAVKK
jgi:hypothetical protein